MRAWARGEALPPLAHTTLPHDQDVATLVLNGQEDLRDHDEDPALGGWRDVPHALRIGRVVARVVGGLDVAGVVAKLATAVLVCGHHGPWAWSGLAGCVPWPALPSTGLEAQSWAGRYSVPTLDLHPALPPASQALSCSSLGDPTSHWLPSAGGQAPILCWFPEAQPNVSFLLSTLGRLA